MPRLKQKESEVEDYEPIANKLKRIRAQRAEERARNVTQSRRKQKHTQRHKDVKQQQAAAAAGLHYNC